MSTRQQKRQEARKNRKNQSSNVESHIYAMTMIHDDDYAERSPLGFDKFMDIGLEVSKVTNVNIKQFLSESIATIFFRMHEANDDSTMTLNAVKREDMSDIQVVCKIMPLNQWLDAVDGIYESEGIRLATEQAESVKCPTNAEQAHEFLEAFISHTQWELNNIRELARQGRATPEMNIPYVIGFIPEPKEGDTLGNCSMQDIALKVKALIDQQW